METASSPKRMCIFYEDEKVSIIDKYNQVIILYLINERALASGFSLYDNEYILSECAKLNPTNEIPEVVYYPQIPVTINSTQPLLEVYVLHGLVYRISLEQNSYGKMEIKKRKKKGTFFFS